MGETLNAAARLLLANILEIPCSLHFKVLPDPEIYVREGPQP